MKSFVSAALAVMLLSPSLATASPYFGAKIGTMQVSFDFDETDSDPTSIGILLGYRWDHVLRGLSGELEVTRSISPGEVRDLDLDVESQGLYLAYQTQGPLYVRGRVGLMDASLDAGVLSEGEGGETFGIAAGYRRGAFAVELDFTSIDDDVSFFSIGLVYSR